MRIQFDETKTWINDKYDGLINRDMTPIYLTDSKEQTTFRLHLTIIKPKKEKSDQNSSRLMLILYLLPPTSRGNYGLTTFIYSKISENLLKVLDAAASVVSNLNDLHTQRKDALEIVAILFT